MSSSMVLEDIHHHHDQNHNNGDAPIRRIGTKRQKGCCSCKPPLRVVLGVYIILNAIIITALVLSIIFAVFEIAILDLSVSYQRLLTVKTQDEVEEFFNFPVLVSNTLQTSLFSTEGFMLPSDNRALNVSHPMIEPFRTLFLSLPRTALATSLFFDDGSQYLMTYQNTRDDGQKTEDVALIHSMVSKDFAVTEAAFFAKNLSNIPISSPLVESFNLTLASAVRPPFYSNAKTLSYLNPANPDFGFYWGGPIGLKTTPSIPAYVALSATQPMINSTFHYVGILGIAVDTSVLSAFLEDVIRETGTKNMQAMVVGLSLEIFATTLDLPTSEEVNIPSGQAVPIGCLRTSESISSTATSDVVLCIKTAMNIGGFSASRKFFERYSYVIGPNDFDSSVQEYKSGIFDVVGKGGIVSNDDLVKDDNGKPFVASFARINNAVINFVLGVAYFTPVDDYFQVLNSGQWIFLGVALGSIFLCIILVDLVARHYLLPLEDVVNLMVATSQLRFDAESKFINNKGYLAHGKNDKINKKRTKVKSFTTGRRASMIAPASSSLPVSTVDVLDDIEFYRNMHSDDDEVDDDDEDLDEKEIERRQQQEVEDSLSPIAEIRALQKAQMNMSNALNSFTKYLSRSIVQELQISGISLGMSKKRATVVLQSDISGFTTLSESVPPNVLSDLLTIYFEKINGIVISHGLVILMFVGDAVFAVSSSIFGGYGNDELKAALCALEMQRTASIHPLTEAWDRLANKRLWQRIGINCGEIFAGITGSTCRLTYTVSGPNADFAQYLEAAGKTFGTLTTVSSTVAAKVKHVFALRLLIPIKLAMNYNDLHSPEFVGTDGFGANNYTNSFDSGGLKDLTSVPRVRAKDVTTHPHNILPPQHSNNNDDDGGQNTNNNSTSTVDVIHPYESTPENPLRVPSSLTQQQDQEPEHDDEVNGETGNSTNDDTSHNNSTTGFSTSTFSQGFSETATSLLGGLPGTVLNAYELVGLLPNINIDEIIKPESAFVKRKSDSAREQEDTDDDLNNNNNILNNNFGDESDAILMDSLQTSSVLGIDPSNSSVVVKTAETNKIDNNKDDDNDKNLVIKERKSSVTFVEVPDEKAAADVRSEQLSCGSEVSNESFLARVAANPLFYLPADNLFKRAYAHTKCTYIASELEMRFSREWTLIVRLFSSGELKKCLTAIEEIKKKSEYGAFFADVNEFGSEEEYEKMYRECIGNDRKCAATFIRANKSEKILVQTCKEVLEQQEKGLEHTFAMKM